MINKKANPLLQKVEQQSRAKVPQDQLAAYDKIVKAGAKVMYSERMHGMLLNQLKAQGNPAMIAGAGVAKLLGILMNQAKGTMPMKAGIPAATALLCEALDMLEQLGRIKVDNDTISEAMQSLGSSLLQLFGVTPAKLDMLLKKQGQPVAQTPAPASPNQPLIGAPA